MELRRASGCWRGFFGLTAWVNQIVPRESGMLDAWFQVFKYPGGTSTQWISAIS
jgi:hypothetical protein